MCTARDTQNLIGDPSHPPVSWLHCLLTQHEPRSLLADRLGDRVQADHHGRDIVVSLALERDLHELLARHRRIAVGLQLAAREPDGVVRVDHVPQPIGSQDDKLVIAVYRLRLKLREPAQSGRLLPAGAVDVPKGARHLQEAREPASVDGAAFGEDARTLKVAAERVVLGQLLRDAASAEHGAAVAQPSEVEVLAVDQQHERGASTADHARHLCEYGQISGAGRSTAALRWSPWSPSSRSGRARLLQHARNGGIRCPRGKLLASFLNLLRNKVSLGFAEAFE
eukprot:1767729-Pleurochrysis_carterae.AAC.1